MYEFVRDDAFRFAREQGIEARTRGEQLELKICPYCRRTERDNQYKFAISLTTGMFKCLRSGCGMTGNMITLAQDFGFSLTGEQSQKKTYRRFGTPKEPIKPKPAAVQYLEKRGISAGITERYEITTQTNADNILVFPFYDERGEMVFVKYRKTDFDKAKDKNKEWCERGGKPILFGMKQCEKGGRLVITEGQIDSLSVAEAGIKNAVSVPTGANGFTWVPHCWDFLNRYSEIVIFGDHENGKITLLDEMAKRFRGKVKHVREEDYLDCKDANELLLKHGKKTVYEAVERAVYLPVDGVVEVADVTGINPHSVEKMETGICDLDDCLMGGLPFGYYHIITGRRGEGKSTLASQMVAEALDQGYSVFAYSGELPVGHFRAWVDYQIAGPEAIKASEINGRAGWFLPKEQKAKIGEWYRGRFFVLDTEKMAQKQVDVLGTTESVIQRYGVRVILIDNLMTAVDLDESARANKYDAQGEFAKKLADMARKYNVLILLVAHKRKQSGDWFDTDPNDDIGGSSYVTNLCGDIIGYSRPTKKEIEKGVDPKNRKLTVTKNRLFGRVSYEGWVMEFEEKSKRIGNGRDELHRHFGWEKDKDGFVNAEGELPW